MSTHTDNTTLVEVLGSVLAHVRNIVGEFFHTTLGFAHFKGVFVNVHTGEDILTHHALVEHNSILIVVTLPRHVRHLQVATESEFAVFGRVTFGKDVAFFHSLTAFADWTQVDGGALVGLAELRQAIFYNRLVEAYESFFFSLVVANADNVGIHIFDNAGAGSLNLSAAVVSEALFNTRTHNRSFAAQQWHCLAHHVGTHQGTVSIVVFEEWNHRSSDRCNLLRRHVHQFHLVGSHHWEVGFQACLHLVANE